jgi:parallel beta-helix repeat protein
MKRRSIFLIVCLTIFLVGCGSSGKFTTGQTQPPVTVPSGGTAGLGSALPCPAGSTAVTTGSIPTFAANTNYCFAAGTYSNFSHTEASGDGWYGQGNAVLDGNGASSYIVSGSGTNIVLDGFTLKDHWQNCTAQTYNCDTGQSMYSAYFSGGNNITVSDNTFGPDWSGGYIGGGGLSFGGTGYLGGPGATPGQYDSSNSWNAGPNNSLVTQNLFTNLGWGSFSASSVTNVTASYNEVRNTDEMSMNTEGDIAALGKFALVSGMQVIGNYVHNNPDTGIWFDVFDVNSTIENNTVSNNQVGLFYEISCNALISGNTFTANGDLDAGTGNDGAGIRISSSGASNFTGTGGSACKSFDNDGTMPGPRNITINSNTFNGNHDGIALYDGHCVNGSLACGSSNPYIQDNNIIVSNNTVASETTAAGTDGDAWAVSVANPGTNQSYTGDTYTIYASHPNAFVGTGGLTNFATWRGQGFDSSGGSCVLTNGAAC